MANAARGMGCGWLRGVLWCYGLLQLSWGKGLESSEKWRRLVYARLMESDMAIWLWA